MRSVQYILSCIICSISLTNCASKSLDKNEYLKYIEDEKNGATVAKVLDDINYSLTYCPEDYIIAKEFKVDKINQKNFNQKKKDLAGHDYFKMRINYKNSNKEVILYNTTNEQDVKERYEYLSYGFEENIFVLRNNKQDTIPPALYHFERTYGIVPYLDLFFTFKKDSLNSKDEKIHVLVNDNLFSNTVLTFEFEKKQLAHLKQLKLY